MTHFVYDVVGEITWTAPNDVLSLNVNVVGGGGGGCGLFSGGEGTSVAAKFHINPNQVFIISVGGGGGSGCGGGSSGIYTEDGVPIIVGGGGGGSGCEENAFGGNGDEDGGGLGGGEHGGNGFGGNGYGDGGNGGNGFGGKGGGNIESLGIGGYGYNKEGDGGYGYGTGGGGGGGAGGGGAGGDSGGGAGGGSYVDLDFIVGSAKYGNGGNGNGGNGLITIDFAVQDFAVQDFAVTLQNTQDSKCFLKDTPILLSENTFVEIQNLKVGDYIQGVITTKPKRIKYIYASIHKFNNIHPFNVPYKIPKGFFNKTIPIQDIYVSGFHGIIFTNGSNDIIFLDVNQIQEFNRVSISDLKSLGYVNDTNEVVYYNIELEELDGMIAGGLPVESVGLK